MEQPLLASEPIPVLTATETIPQPLMIEEEQVPVSEYVAAETQLPITEQIPVTLKIFEEVPIPPADPILRQKTGTRCITSSANQKGLCNQNKLNRLH